MTDRATDDPEDEVQRLMDLEIGEPGDGILVWRPCESGIVCETYDPRPMSGLRDHLTGEFWCWADIDGLMKYRGVQLRPATSADREELGRSQR